MTTFSIGPTTFHIVPSGHALGYKVYGVRTTGGQHVGSVYGWYIAAPTPTDPDGKRWCASAEPGGLNGAAVFDSTMTAARAVAVRWLARQGRAA